MRLQERLRTRKSSRLQSSQCLTSMEISLSHSTFLKVIKAIIYNLLDSARMEKLRYDLEITEQDCDTLNRREKLLNFRITKFSAVNNLKTDMAPFTTLWSIAASFTKVYESKDMIYFKQKPYSVAFRFIL